MDFKGVLTEEELGRVGGDVLAKIEAAYRGELASAIEAESKRSSAKFESLMEVVGRKVDEKVGEAVAASIGRQKADAINGKLFEALQKITAIVEQAGIPATEVTKKLKQELEIADKKLQDAYVDRENIKKKLNYQAKLNRIYTLTAGCSPDIVNAVIERFKNEDIRAIDKNSIADFIDNNDTGDGVTMNIDADVVNTGGVGGSQEPMDGIMDKTKTGRMADFSLLPYESVYPAVPTINLSGDNYRTVLWNAIMGYVEIDAAIEGPLVDEGDGVRDSHTS